MNNRSENLHKVIKIRKLTWGVAEIIEAGTGGIVAGVDGRCANKEANIRFFSQSFEFPDEETEVEGGRVSNRETDALLAGKGATLLSSCDPPASSELGRFLPPLPTLSAGDEVPLLNPKLFSRGSSFPPLTTTTPPPPVCK